MTERKATEVLEEILEKLCTVEALCKNIDFNYKIIISRLDKMKNPDLETLTSSKSVITLNKPEHEVEVQPKILVSNESSKLSNNLDFPEAIVPSNSKTIVTQTVLYPTEVGKNNKVALAQVKLLDSERQEISKTITDSAGRWKLEINPGKYFIHITKPSSNKKPKIDHYFPILIDGSLKILELETLNVKNEK